MSGPTLMHAGYNPVLVTLSVAIAILSAYVALDLGARVRGAAPGQRWAWVAGAAGAMGGGIWSMHFIGMLAFNLCTPVHYDHGVTLLSALPSIGASWVALSLISRPQLRRTHLAVGGVLVGAGIGAMHYAGMAGMRMSLDLYYDPTMFALSIVVAVVLTVASGLEYLLTERHRQEPGS